MMQLRIAGSRVSRDVGCTSSDARVGYRRTVLASRGCLALRSGVLRPQCMSRGFPNRALPPAMRNGLIEDCLAPPCRIVGGELTLMGLGGAGDRPDEADHLASDRGGDDGIGLAQRSERPVAGAQAPL